MKNNTNKQNVTYTMKSLLEYGLRSWGEYKRPFKFGIIVQSMSEILK